MNVNDYDTFAAERQDELKKGKKLPHRYVEKPMMRDMLPRLEGKKVLMLGCGSGEESKLLEEKGADDLTGVDLSEQSIKLASQSYPDHNFSVGDMHQLEFDDNLFDFVYSSLAVHYSGQPEKVYREIWRVLKPGGQFLFSISHPVRWASEEIEIDGVKTKLIGYSKDPNKPRVYGNYNNFEQYDEHFPSGEVLRFWVGPPSMTFSQLRNAGFSVDKFVESKAVEESKNEHPYYYQRYSRLPQFIAFLAVKE